MREDVRQDALLALSHSALVDDDVDRLRLEALAGLVQLFEPAAVGFLALDEPSRRATPICTLGDADALSSATSDWPPDAALPRPATDRGRAIVAVPLTEDGRANELLVAMWNAPEPPVGAGTFATALCNLVAIASKRSRVEDALRQNETLSSLGTLVAGVAHEINNPLSFVQGNVELARMNLRDLADGAVSEEEASTLIERTIEQLDGALKGVEQVAAISRGLKRVAKSRLRERRRADLNELVETALLIANTRIPPATRISVELDADQPIHVDTNGISQVLLNLLINAGDALIGRETPALHIRTRDEGRFTLTEISDNGPGIPESLRASIFTPFLTSKPQGTGLGLSISHRIVREHGGRMSFETDATKGTTFRIELPAAPRIGNEAFSQDEAGAKIGGR